LNPVAASFGYPFRRGAGRAWAIGLPLVVVLPIGLVPLLGYAVAAVRASAIDATAPPPPWTPLRRLLADGVLAALLMAALTLPFTLLGWLLAPVAAGAIAPLFGDPFLRAAFGALMAGALVAFPWGCLVLLVVPGALARFARSGAARDLFDVAGGAAVVRAHFATWNLVVVAIVTAWALGIAAAGLACVGILPGVFFAILASSHAIAALVDA
jgi:hypothetical protein